MATEEAARKAAKEEADRAAYCLTNRPDSEPCYPLGLRGTYGDGPLEHFARPNTGWQSDRAFDLHVPCGTPVYAVEKGIIGKGFGKLKGNSPSLKGLRLNLETKTERYYYSHLSNFAKDIEPGVTVTKGQLLGWSGDGGEPLACHLHFGIKCEDPKHFLDRAVMRGSRFPWQLMTDDERNEFTIPELRPERPPLPPTDDKRSKDSSEDESNESSKDSSEGESSSEHNWEHTDYNPPRDQLKHIADSGSWGV